MADPSCPGGGIEMGGVIPPLVSRARSPVGRMVGGGRGASEERCTGMLMMAQSA